MFEYIKAGRCVGPVTGAELLALIELGVIGDDAPVRRVGELGFHTAREIAIVLHTERGLTGSQPPPRLTRSSRPAAGAYTVFTSAPPIPPHPAPRLHSPARSARGAAIAATAERRGAGGDAHLPARCAQCSADNPSDARFCGACGHALAI